MNKFFVGLHHPSDAWPFLRSMISINRIKNRQSNFKVNQWILDSGAFTEISMHGKWRTEPEIYADQINRWSTCGNLAAAVTQDVMCEPFILAKTGLSIEHHQEITTKRYLRLVDATDCYVMPVLQGYTPDQYCEHLDMYGSILGFGQWVGVGSVCRRNSSPEVIHDILSGIKTKRPDLKLHGFGLKITSLAHDGVCDLLESSDSMAWSKRGRHDSDANDPREALKYATQVETLINRPLFIQQSLFQWWQS